MAPRGRIAAIQALFLVSGFCGLIYESIWSHYLKLFLGHAAYAQSVVLVVFIGGMALGAAAAGRYAHKLKRPLVWYAAAEFLVGWAGVVFHHVFTAATGWGYDALLPATCSVDSWCVSSWLLAAVLILPQSVLLGTTFPLMTSGLLRLAPESPGRRIALLYFLNSLGAVAGVLAGIFVLVPHAGLPGASLIAGIANVLLAIAVYIVAGPQPPTASSRDAAGNAAVAAPWLLLGVAAFTGLSSFGYEIAWIRMLSLVLGASTHAFELMLASFILGLALGGAWIRRRIDRFSAPRAFLGYVQIAMGLAALASLVLYDWAFDAMAWLIGSLAKTDGGYALFNLGSAGIAMAIMLPATFAAGMTLPLITYLLLRDGYGERAIGYVYAWNTLGAIMGVLIAVHVGLPQLGLAGTLIAAAAIDVALGIALLGRWRRSRAGVVAAIACVASACALAVAPFVLRIDASRTVSAVYRTGLPRLDQSAATVYNRDGKTATVNVTRTEDGVVTIRTNGKPDAAANVGPDRSWIVSDELTMVLAAALPLRYNPGARDVAVIGFGSGMTTAAFLDAAIDRVDTIEIEPLMIEGARQFADKSARAYTDPRSRVVIDDAKSYFAKAGRRYDIIVSEPSNPWVAGVSSLFTGEFYGQADRFLKPGGVLVQWLQAYEFDQRLTAAVVKSLLDVFPNVTLYSTNGSDMLLVARRELELVDDPAAPFAHPDLAGRLASIGIRSPADMDRRLLLGPSSVPLLFRSVDVPPNSDYFPIVDLDAPAARFKGSTAREVIDILAAPLPAVDLVERRGPPVALPPEPPPQSLTLDERWLRARHGHEFLTGSGFAGGAPLPPLASARTLANARLLLVDCVAANSATALWDSVVTLSGEFAVALPAADIDRFVAVIERSRCRKQLPEATAEWLRLFRAMGRREPGPAADAAAVLLARDDLTILQREFAALTAIAGYLGSDRRGRAQRVLFAQNRHLRPEFRASAIYRFVQEVTMR
ncbi:MAG: spermidine synthase [Vicinamibacteria bacterium]